MLKTNIGQRRRTLAMNEQRIEERNNSNEWIKGRKKEQQHLLLRMYKGQRRRAKQWLKMNKVCKIGTFCLKNKNINSC
jgi:hypothetical protein